MANCMPLLPVRFVFVSGRVANQRILLSVDTLI